MPAPPKICKVRLSPDDLISIIQKRGNEQGAEVAGTLSHYAYEQAKLHLLAEDLFGMLARVVKAAKGGGISQPFLHEATAILEKVTYERR
jgi:hypothetical protein